MADEIFGLFGHGGSNDDHSDNDEYNRTRNNEDGDSWPTPKEDNEAGVCDYIEVDRIVDSTDDTDSTSPRGWFW